MSKIPVTREDTDGLSAKRKITITREDLDQASTDGLLSSKQANDLWTHLSARSSTRPGFDLASLLWYSGSVVIMLAMGWFLGQIWDLYSGGAIVFTAAAYALGFVLIGRKLWNTDDLKVPGGLLFTLAVTMAPLAVYGLEKLSGSSLDNASQRLLIEGSLVAAGALAISFVRFPFLTAPISVGLWLVAIEAINMLGGPNGLSWDQERFVTGGFGLVMLVGSYLVDRRTKEDFSFWGYLVGATAFWWALTLSDHGSELAKFVYFLINAGLMLVSVLLNRRIFVIYGSVGVVGYLGYLTWTVFENSALFPIALSAMGLGIIFLGIKYHRNRDKVTQAVLNLVPEGLRNWLPSNR